MDQLKLTFSFSPKVRPQVTRALTTFYLASFGVEHFTQVRNSVGAFPPNNVFNYSFHCAPA